MPWLSATVAFVLPLRLTLNVWLDSAVVSPRTDTAMLCVVVPGLNVRVPDVPM